MIGNTYYSFTTFYIKTDNEIVFADTLDPKDIYDYNYNLDGETERVGAEILFEHYFDNLTLRESYTYTKAEITSGKYDGSDMPGVPENRATVGATYDFTTDLKVNTDLNYVGKTYDTSDFNNEYGKTNSFVTVDLNLNYAYDPTLNLIESTMNMLVEV